MMKRGNGPTSATLTNGIGAYIILVVMHVHHSHNRITEEECGSITVYCTAGIIVQYSAVPLCARLRNLPERAPEPCSWGEHSRLITPKFESLVLTKGELKAVIYVPFSGHGSCSFHHGGIQLEIIEASGWMLLRRNG
jgi:hypothetical protein